MRLVLQHADQIRGLVVHEFVNVPGVFFEAGRVYLAQTVEGGDAEFVGAESHNGTMSLVGGEDGARLEARSTLPPDPCWCNRGREVSVGNWGERREAGRYDNAFVD